MEGCVKLGVVKDLAGAYRQAALVVNPVRSGTGLAIKSIEALGHGRPLTSSTQGARGLEGAVGHGLRIADTCEEWVTRLVPLLEHRDARAAESRRAYEFARHWNSEQIEPLQSLLETSRTPSECLELP
jgi:hypothetical protein